MGTSAKPTEHIDARADQFIDVENTLTENDERANKTVKRGEIEWVDEIPFPDLPEHEKARIHSELQQETSMVVVRKPFSETVQKKVNAGKAVSAEGLAEETHLKIVVGGDSFTSEVFVPVPNQGEYEGSYLDQVISMCGGDDYEITALNARRVWVVNGEYSERLLTDEMADTLIWAYRNGYGGFDDGDFTPSNRLDATEKLARNIGSGTQWILFMAAILSVFLWEVIAIIWAAVACGIAVLMLAGGLENSNDSRKGKETVLRVLIGLHREHPSVASYAESLIDWAEE